VTRHLRGHNRRYLWSAGRTARASAIAASKAGRWERSTHRTILVCHGSSGERYAALSHTTRGCKLNQQEFLHVLPCARGGRLARRWSFMRGWGCRFIVQSCKTHMFHSFCSYSKARRDVQLGTTRRSWKCCLLRKQSTKIEGQVSPAHHHANCVHDVPLTDTLLVTGKT